MQAFSRGEKGGIALVCDKPGLGWDSSALVLKELVRGSSHSSHSTSCRELTFRQWRQHQVDGLKKKEEEGPSTKGWWCPGQDACQRVQPKHLCEAAAELSSVKKQMLRSPTPSWLLYNKRYHETIRMAEIVYIFRFLLLLLSKFSPLDLKLLSGPHKHVQFLIYCSQICLFWLRI